MVDSVDDRDDPPEFIRERRRGSPKVISSVRVVEALIIAGVSTLVMQLYTIPKIEAKIEAMNEKAKENREEYTRDIKEVKDSVNKLRDDLYAPRAFQNRLSQYEPVTKEHEK